MLSMFTHQRGWAEVELPQERGGGATTREGRRSYRKRGEVELPQQGVGGDTARDCLQLTSVCGGIPLLLP